MNDKAKARELARSGVVMEVNDFLSYSSLNSYIECGERWRLEKGRGKTSGSWYATVAGKVIHAATEAYDRGETSIPDFDFLMNFPEAVKEEEARGVVLRASQKKGMASTTWAGGPLGKDFDWWMQYGPQIVNLYPAWRDEHPEWEIAKVVDKKTGEEIPAIELELWINFGSEPSMGFIDRVFRHADTGEYLIVDIKTGRLPVSDLQLADYGVGLEENYGIKATWGAFWHPWQPRKVAGQEQKPLTSGLTDAVDLTAYSRAFLESRYEMARDGIMAGVFLPNVSMMCKGCGVRKFCRAKAGTHSATVPVREYFIQKRERGDFVRNAVLEEVVSEEDLTASE